jgi:hypothetical protein
MDCFFADREATPRTDVFDRLIRPWIGRGSA